MRYYKHKHANGSLTHVWMLKFQITHPESHPLYNGIQLLTELDAVPVPAKLHFTNKTLIWFNASAGILGLWSRGSGLLIPIDQLLYLILEHTCTFRGEAISESLYIDTFPRPPSGKICLGQCLPTRPSRLAQRNHEWVAKEMRQLANAPIFQSTLENTIRFSCFSLPY